MIGAILTGGYGKRMQGLSQDIPKNLLELREGYTILDRQLRDFKMAGVNDVYMLTGYRGEMIESKIGNSWKGISIKYLKEDEPMGTLFSVRNLLSHVSDDVILRNGDTVCDLFIGDFIEFSISRGEAATVLAVRMRSPYGILGIKGGKVVWFKEKPFLNHYINAGTYFLKKRVREYVGMEYEGRDIENTLFRRLAERNELSAFKYKGLWISVDSLKDYEELRNIYSRRMDYEFGYEEFGDDSHIYHIIRNRKLRIKGSGAMRILRGKVLLNGKSVSGRVEIGGNDEIETENESVVEMGRDVSLISPE